jgi:hypothetical protein
MEYSYTSVIKDIISNLSSSESTGIEIGTHKGTSARSMLTCPNVKKIFLVDPYKAFPKDVYDGSQKQSLFDRRMKRAAKKLSGFESKRYEFVRKTSEEAAKVINEKLNFAYIDGNHKYEFVKDDITWWFKKLKPGGICLGDDWVERNDTRVGPLRYQYYELKGLVRAVKEFVTENSNSVVHEPAHEGMRFNYEVRRPGLYVSPPTRRNLRIWWFIKK